MTDQERPRDPGELPEGTTPDGTQPEQPVVPESEQPTIGWTPPTSPTPPPSTWGAESPPPPPLEPTPPPPSTWGAQPPPPPPASGPLISASPSSAAGWTQPTQAAPGQQGLPPGLVFSATAPRFVAYLIDGFLLAIVGSVVNGVFGARVPFDPSSAGGFATRFTGGDVAATIVTVVISGAYFIGFWSGGRRATLGQMALRIQVGNAFDGKALTVTQAAKRWLALGEFLQVFAISVSAAAAIASAGFLWAIVLFITTATSPTKQGLHDKFANSAVVRPVGASNALVWGCLILLALVIIVPILLFAALFPQMSTVLSEIGQSI